MGALIALSRSALIRFGILARGGGAIVRRGAIPVVGGAAGFGIGEALFGGDDRRSRRRRKRVFTAMDRADISFITATLGAPAGKSVAMIIAARV